jgi:hypothetical protein
MKRTETNRRSSGNDYAYYTQKSEKPAPISKKRIEELNALPDEKIDFSDIPELDAEFWENAEWVESDKT